MATAPKAHVVEGPVTAKHLKEAKLLLKGVTKFLRYNDDLISPENKAKIAQHEAAFRSAMEKPDIPVKELEELAGQLTKACEKSVPGYKPSAIRENIEVIFVAVVIAMGIRAYFAQPFKIPTGSMQPTLNGVIAYPHDSINSNHDYATSEDSPSAGRRLWEWFWYGRTWVNLVAEDDDIVLLRHGPGGFEEKTSFKFFTYTRIPMQSGRAHKIPGTIAKVQDLINPRLFLNPIVKKGDVIAKGFVDTGDQVIVDKFSYHWIKPKRDDVFVFTTNDIPYIQAGIDPRMGSQHYIKRLAGTPGDHLQVKNGKLYINGEVAPEPGFQKVMSKENGYRGYSNQGVHLDVQLEPNQYFAMGDNSYNSSDSRTWGHVPDKNIVGRAVFVYLPFGHHFGPIH
ncbi:MAG: signal peptidase I [Verrucomicrobiae bacterium]|nr:signal peptidase I [Verrucomicrobiae bacterium]